MSTHYGSSQPGPTQGFSQPQYRCCGEDFSSSISYREHITKPGRKCGICGRRLFHLEDYDKHLEKHERGTARPAAPEGVENLEVLVSPEVQKLRSILAQEERQESLREASVAALEKKARMKEEKAERKKERAEKKKRKEEEAQQEAERKRQEVERKKREVEEKRQEEKRRRMDAKKRRAAQEKSLEAERKRHEAEEKRQEAEEKRQEAERKRQEERKKEEAQRKQEAERKKEEAKRKREAERKKEEERKRQEKERKKQEEKRKRQEAERKRQEAERRRQESLKPIQCHLCLKRFKTPAAYAQHLESNSRKHPNVKRHHVTQAVHMLDIIPPITLAPSIGSEYQPSTLGHTESVTGSSTISPFTSVPSSPRTDADGSWILLGDEDSVSGSVVLASSVSTAMSRVADSPPPPHTFSPLDEPTTYTPNDFASLGIPYACPICCKTFRTVVRLTHHMNSPVHDPDAFKCPKPECGRQFALVSGLIQHLESGTCKLASAGEIFERFALLTARFSKLLAA
ncbi:hypothetical protein FA13DRAFT_671935 [Coprinellus micaceus]|uniref:C2H2-type domain-containing protein n=1 Tax=Coprinellus micaceus TaxID=71717 RepID=A0A4Y7T6R0_COPMI|nr:hypothetical protein FA13DRAFT_671935 [Coprinellus micaceus]